VDPSCFSVGDEALVEMGPGLLQFLNFRDSRGKRLGDGLAPEWVIPIGAAGTAAFAVVCEEANPWTAVANDVELLRPCGEDETLLATASIDAMRRASVRIPYQVVSREKGDRIVRGAFVFACVGPEGPRPYDVRIHRTHGEEAPAAQPTAAAIAVGSAALASRSERGRLADALLPRSLARGLRLTYWHVLSQRGPQRAASPGEFVAGLVRVLRSSEGRQAPSAPAIPLPARPPLAWTARSATLRPGESASFSLEIFHAGPGELSGEIEIVLPPGHGLESDVSGGPVRLPPGQVATLTILVTARRPDEVNLGRPWPLACILRREGAEIASDRLLVSVPDPSPGTIFYVLTEDCETFDGGPRTGDYGAAGVLGNRNDFMDPEEYRIQMIEKPEALNAIAEKHGARWTHFWTAPQRFAAEWAAARSTTGAWDRIVSDLDESIRRGSRRHEYAPHVHFDFEPDSKLPPQPRLSYDAKTDGILPNEYYDPASNRNHKYHGWDGARKGIAYVRAEGDLSTLDSKKGSLRKSVRFLADLSFGGFFSAASRTGAADFGASPADLEVSARAFLANGLLANSDAGVYETAEPLPRGRQIYFCKSADLDAEIDELREARLVELRAPDQMLEQGSTEQLNAWFDRRYSESLGPGVRAIVAMTHAMFMKGSPDPFRDSSGGDFDRLDHHLEHVRRTYPGVRFATASEAVLEYLDYYSPELRAIVTRPRVRSTDGTTFLFPIRILGRGIPLSPGRPADLTVQAPACFEPEEIRSMEVLEEGASRELAAAGASREELPAVRFLASRREGYVLKIVSTRPRPRVLFEPGEFPGLWSSGAGTFEELPEAEMPDLLRLERPRLLSGERKPLGEVAPGDRWEWAYPGGLFQLLVNPVAGNAHPLGRRLHPYGRFSEGIAVDAAGKLFGDAVAPARIDLQWVRPVRGQADFRLVATVEAIDASSLTLANSVSESGIEVARLKLTLRRAPAA
jgi:hypothetical protein